jgi:hypothetical protein
VALALIASCRLPTESEDEEQDAINSTLRMFETKAVVNPQFKS